MIRGQGYAFYIKDKHRVGGSKIPYLKEILLPPTLSLTYLITSLLQHLLASYGINF